MFIGKSIFSSILAYILRYCLNSDVMKAMDIFGILHILVNSVSERCTLLGGFFFT